MEPILIPLTPEMAEEAEYMRRMVAERFRQFAAGEYYPEPSKPKPSRIAVWCERVIDAWHVLRGEAHVHFGDDDE